jgi:hypothetical protein
MTFNTYKQVRNNVIARRGSTVALEAAGAANMAQYAALMTAAYRWAFLGYDWGQLRVTEEIPVVNSLAAIPTERNGFVKVYTQDPRPSTSLAIPIYPTLVDADGLWLDTTATTCWATYDPLPMQFTAEAWDVAASYSTNDAVYDDVSGNCYVAKVTIAPGTALTDSTKWAAQRIWTALQESLILYVLAELASDRSEQAQYQILMSKAELALESEWVRNQLQPSYD